VFAAEIRELDLGVKVAIEFEIRGVSANFDHRNRRERGQSRVWP
jgi:hypothetical protein